MHVDDDIREYLLAELWDRYVRVVAKYGAQAEDACRYRPILITAGELDGLLSALERYLHAIGYPPTVHSNQR